MESEEDKALNFLNRQSGEEDEPIVVESEISKKYYELNKIFDTFFTPDSLSVGKDKSKEERDKLKINDSSFVYGEVVN